MTPTLRKLHRVAASLSMLLLLATTIGAADAPSTFANRKRTPTLAILAFMNANELASKDGLGVSIASMFGTHLKNETSFMVLERSQIGKLATEQNLSASGLTEAQRDQLGKLFQAEAILTGEVSRFGDLIQLDARLISVETGQVLVAEYAQIQGYDKLRAAILQISKSLELKYLRRWMGDLVVSVQPVEGEIYLDDQYLGKASLKEPLKVENLLEGTYSLRVLASGYSNYTEAVAIKPKIRREVQVAMKSLPGTLKLMSEPQGAKVTINNKELGKTPMQIDTVAEGQYRVVYELPGFVSMDRQVEVRSGQQTEVKGVLKVKPGSLAVTSEPSGADIYLNDQRMGVTPLVIDNVVPGTVSVRVEKGQYSTLRDVVTVKPGTQASYAAPLQRLTGRLTVVPMGDSVKVKIREASGRLVEERMAPFHKLDLDIGDYDVELERSFHVPQKLRVTIRDDHEARLEPKLTEKAATLTVGSSESAADVWVDGEYLGKAAGAKVDLPKGKHTIVAAGFFGDSRQQVELKPDEKRHVDMVQGQGSTARWAIPLGVLLSMTLVLIMGR
ncbi:MAG: FlgO family outer membrane protein [Fibrobacterota bacterium]